MSKDNVDVEILADWMCCAALQINDGFMFLRFLVRLAASDAKYVYGKFSEDEDITVEPGDDLGVRAIIARFAEALDEALRFRKEDE